MILRNTKPGIFIDLNNIFYNSELFSYDTHYLPHTRRKMPTAERVFYVLHLNLL